MPPIKNAAELKPAAGKGFLREGTPQYKAVNQFNQKLLDLQDKLKNTNEKNLREKVSKYSRDLMTLQMHNAPFTNKDDLETAISDVTIDLPYYLKTPEKGGEEKTGYQILVEAGAKYGTFTKAELDEAMTYVGQGMGIGNIGVDDPEKEKEKQQKQQEQEAQNELAAQQQAVIDAQANIALLDKEEEEQREEEKPYTEKWYKQHRENLKKDEKGYQPQTNELPQRKQVKDGHFMEGSGLQVNRALRDMGILQNEEDGNIPVRNGVPQVFIVKDGKVSTLEENGITNLGVKEGNFFHGNPELAKAVLRGEVFAYPSGERYPVQLQGQVEKDAHNSMNVSHSAPLKPQGEVHKIILPPDPGLSTKPRWYHKAFKFWGNNRKICDDYAASVAKRNEWLKEAEKVAKESGKALPESDRIARAIEEKFGAKRTKEVRKEELAEGFRKYDAERKATNAKEAYAASQDANKVNKGIEIAMNVYASKPQIREDWVRKEAGDGGLYRREDFNRLTRTELDPGTVKIGDKQVSEREFATLALFGSLDPDIGVKAQKEAVTDPTAMLAGMQQKGYSEKVSKEILLKSVANAYTTDILHTEPRMNLYFNSAVNGGRQKAEEALKDYAQGSKEKLAEVLSRAVEYTGENIGIKTCRTNKGTEGLNGLTQLANEALDLMERDLELKQLAKEKYEQRDREFCEAMNAQVSKYDKDGKPPLKPRSFEENVKNIRDFQKFSEIEQKGFDAQNALHQARAQDKELPQAEKEACIKDVLKANMVAALHQQQARQRGMDNETKENGLNTGRVVLKKYTDALAEEALAAMMRDDDDDSPNLGNAVSAGGGSSLPASASGIIQSGLEARFTEKPPVIGMVNDPKEMRKLDQQAEKIMREDGLDQLNVEDLCAALKGDATMKNTPYKGNNLILRAAKLAEPQKQGENLQKQMILGNDQHQVNNDDQIIGM